LTIGLVHHWDAGFAAHTGPVHQHLQLEGISLRSAPSAMPTAIPCSTETHLASGSQVDPLTPSQPSAMPSVHAGRPRCLGGFGRAVQQFSYLLGEIPGSGYRAPEGEPDVVGLRWTGDPEHEAVPVDSDGPDLMCTDG
jgi:hypothetical protein